MYFNTKPGRFPEKMDKTTTHNTFITSLHGFHEVVLFGIQANKKPVIHTLAAIYMETDNHKLCAKTRFERYPKAAHHNNESTTQAESLLYIMEHIQ